MNQLKITRFPALDSLSTEALNTLCTNLSYSGAHVRVVLFTSRYEKEGKSWIAMNVMRTLAGYGRRVLLVDSDLRHATLAGHYQFSFSQEEALGLAHYLDGTCGLEEAVYQTDLPGADILPAGRLVPDAMQLLTSPRYQEMMTLLRDRYDMVLVDAPAAGVLVDAVEIARYCDGAVIVVGYNKGRGQDIGELTSKIARTGCQVLGAVINRVKPKFFPKRKVF